MHNPSAGAKITFAQFEVWERVQAIPPLDGPPPLSKHHHHAKRSGQALSDALPALACEVIRGPTWKATSSLMPIQNRATATATDLEKNYVFLRTIIESSPCRAWASGLLNKDRNRKNWNALENSS